MDDEGSGRPSPSRFANASCVYDRGTSEWVEGGDSFGRVNYLYIFHREMSTLRSVTDGSSSHLCAAKSELEPLVHRQLVQP